MISCVTICVFLLSQKLAFAPPLVHAICFHAVLHHSPKGCRRFFLEAIRQTPHPVTHIGHQRSQQVATEAKWNSSLNLLNKNHHFSPHVLVPPHPVTPLRILFAPSVVTGPAPAERGEGSEALRGTWFGPGSRSVARGRSGVSRRDMVLGWVSSVTSVFHGLMTAIIKRGSGCS